MNVTLKRSAFARCARGPDCSAKPVVAFVPHRKCAALIGCMLLLLFHSKDTSGIPCAAELHSSRL
jgi:hypothetical protein